MSPPCSAANNVLGDVPYTLEVSSPGVDRPLTGAAALAARPEIARLVRVKVTGEGPVEGRVLAADADGVTLGLTKPRGGLPRLPYVDMGAGSVQEQGVRPDSRTPESLTTLVIRSLTRCSTSAQHRGPSGLAAMDIVP